MTKTSDNQINRPAIIAEVLRDLAELKGKSSVNQYAIEENIVFFEACRSPFSYIWWLISRAPKIDGEKLLEINDLLPKWDEAMHSQLTALEKKDFPGLIKPLVDRICQFIQKENRPLILVDFGFGGMETERQVIEKLLKEKYTQRIVFIGIDQSKTSHEIAQDNLEELKSFIGVHNVVDLDEQSLKGLIASEKNNHAVILCYNDIFNLDKCFSNNAFDLIFHSLFKHHLTDTEKEKLDAISVKLAKRAMEYDGYKSWPHIAGPHTLAGWSNPVFLNATIFSDLKYYGKKQLKNPKPNWQVSFFKIGTYLRECFKNSQDK